jgi:circadian clock protein KaiB
MKPGMKQSDMFTFRLYVAGNTLNSSQAIANLATLCRSHLLDRHQVEVIDVLLHPKRALEDSVFMTPTLLKLAPVPLRRIIGTLSQSQTVLDALGI